MPELSDRTSKVTTQQLPQREVASGVVNLGNTCYMNAVLQALAHAPELCLAIDHEPHHLTCPIARENQDRRRKSPTLSDDGARKRPSRKSRRSGKKSPATTDSEDSVDVDFCTLCEVEDHISQVHSLGGQPVAPDIFVNGFIDHVAPPWFKLGVQEDSHEFLRLLIDAMQKSSSNEEGSRENVDDLYPFKLFRGTVESNVKCDSCGATSATIDPIEDIGLEVSQSTPGSSLTDLSSAFARFTKAEPLTGYKCDKCRTTGRATKQSRLASIPPVLTIHLKRFRYGLDGKPLPPPAPRRGREVSQLLGASGSAKIEGHIKFLEIFDLKPFLTDKMKDKVKNMFCRLFAVIVHAGKNSHSGHYVAYVRNLSKNEWWKMDDARVSKVTSQEVLSAEAYMLFYRVVDHPVAQQLRKKQAAAESRQQQEQEKQTEAAARPISEVVTKGRKRMRETPAHTTGEEWARAKTRLPPAFVSLLRRAEEFISGNIEFTPEFFKVILEEASRGKVGMGPSCDVCDDDIEGGTDRFRPGLVELLCRLASKATSDGIGLIKREDSAKPHESERTQKKTPIIVPVIEADETIL